MEKIEIHPPMRIHIIPVGNSSIERLLKPARYLKAERVYLLTIRGKDAFAKEYSEIKEKLLENLLKKKSDLIEIKADYYDLEDFLGIISAICQKEKEKGNEIWINISGGTMISVVGTLASVYYGIKPYFAKYDYNKKEIEEGALIPPIPNYPILKPDEKIMQLLILMDREMKELKTSKIQKRRCIDLIKNNNLDIDFTGSHTSIYNKLNNRYLLPMEVQRFIKIHKSTHSEIEITPDGYFAMKVFGLQKI